MPVVRRIFNKSSQRPCAPLELFSNLITDNSMNFLETHEVVKRYAAHLALDRVSIEVPEGKVFGLLGPNGAGKTTLIRIINRITAPDSGEVSLNGRPLRPDDVFRIGYLPEERGLYKKMKAGEQAIYLARLKGLSARTARERTRRWFEKFDMMPWWNKKLEELSKGMQQKIQFIITMIHEPDLLIFDEPFSGFDPVNAEMLKKEILRLKEAGKTVIFSTHNMTSVEEICDTFALIDRAKVVLQGDVQEVRNRYRTQTFRIRVAGDTLPDRPELYTILSEKQQYRSIEARIRQTGPGTPSDLLRTLLQSQEILCFEEELPSMQDLFIRVVSRPAAGTPTLSSPETAGQPAAPDQSAPDRNQ